MKSKYCLLICCFCLALVWPGSLMAQEPESCALSRVQSATARLATATPLHVKRMNQYNITFYGLDLHLERNSIAIAGTVTLEARLTNSALDTFAFELHPNFQIASVIINGVQQASITRNGGDVSVKLTTPVVAPNTIKAVIAYAGTAPQNATAAIGNGFSSATEPTWGNQITWSLSEPYAAYEWWPTKQVLTDKADSIHVFITTSSENKAGSNGLLTRTVELPNGKKRYEWKSGYPIAYYLVSVAVSDYEEYLISANPDGVVVPILNYIYKGGALDKFRNEMNVTAPLLEYFSTIFTLYPFAKEKYGHSMAPMGGGMEHQTMTTQSTFTFTLTAHELAHQWFGDNVTCASWEDIWLNEGFASYAEYLALQHLKPQDAKPWMKTAHQIAKSSPDGSVHVPDTTNVGRIFNYRLTYKKAAAVVHMLRYELNNDVLFFKALSNYQQQYGGKTATTANLQQVFEQTTGLSLNYFFEQWYAGSGYPVFELEWNQEGRKVLLLSKQSPSSSTPFFKTSIAYRILTATTDTTIRVSHNRPEEKYLFTLTKDEPVTNIIVDPDQWVLHHTLQVLQNTALPVPEELVKEPVVYPNPAFATLHVMDLPFQATTAMVYDKIGRKMWQQQVHTKSEIEIDIRRLPTGLYILYITDGESHERVRFLKMDQP